MPSYPAGPYSVEIPMIYQNLSHVLELNCDVVGTVDTGDSPASVTLETQSGLGANLDVAVNAFWTACRSFFNSATLASGYTLWKHIPETTEKTYISAGSLTTPNGSSPAANEPAGLVILTWRSAGGNIMKITLLEPVTEARKDRVPMLSAANANVAALNTFVMSNDNWIMARDRSFPVAPMNASFGQHESTYRRRFRS